MTVSAANTLVLCPAFASIEPECEHGLRELERAGFTVWRRWGGSAIDRVRSEIATEALATEADGFMWIDADVGFDPNDVLKLLAHDRPWVCGIYARKSPKGGLSAHVTAPRVIFGEGGGLLEIPGGGFGFMFTSRAIYEALDAPEVLCNEQKIRPFFLPMLKDGRYLTEDLAFCARAREAGYQLQADTTIRLCHVGRYRYWVEDAGNAIERGASCVAEMCD